MPSQTDSLLNAIASRRTYYALTDTSPIPDSRILRIINTIAQHAPSSHNSQSTRLVVLLRDEHTRLWDTTREVLRGLVPGSKFEPTEQKLRGLGAAFGTVLFYEDKNVVARLQAEYALYKDRFPIWSEHTNAMHQILLWTALESEGLGCNLQHYDPLIDEDISRMWNVSPEWSLKAQLVFGGVGAQPKSKTYEPLAERVFIHGI